LNTVPLTSQNQYIIWGNYLDILFDLKGDSFLGKPQSGQKVLIFVVNMENPLK
jgi:hypothetical protein